MPVQPIGDLNLFYQVRGDPNSREVLLALHPATVNGDLFSWALPRARNHLRILLPDQRGHGKTANPAPDMHMSRLIDDMLGLLDALDVRRLHGVGYSMGAAVLLGIAQEAPEKVKSLLLMGATHRAPTPEQLMYLAGPLDHRKGVVLEATHPVTGIRGGWTIELARLNRLHTPVAIIGGDREQVQDVEAYVELYRALHDAQLYIVPDCDHFGFHTNPAVRHYLEAWYRTLV